LFRDFFAHPASVVLAIRPDAQSGFFFWENGNVERSRPYSTFICRSEALGFAPRPLKEFRVPAAGPAVRHSLNKKLLWIPAAAGIALAMLWSPRVPFEGRRERSQEALATERPVFAPPPVPEQRQVRSATVIAPSIQQAARQVTGSVPPPSPAEPRGARTAGEPRTKRQTEQFRMVAANVPAKPTTVKRSIAAKPALAVVKKSSARLAEVPAKVRKRVSPPRLEERTPVLVRVRIGTDGYVKSAHLLTGSASAATASAVMRAARAWRFTPARRANRPVESEMVLTFQPGAPTASKL
jgi:TonB family protein